MLIKDLWKEADKCSVLADCAERLFAVKDLLVKVGSQEAVDHVIKALDVILGGSAFRLIDDARFHLNMDDDVDGLSRRSYLAYRAFMYDRTLANLYPELWEEAERYCEKRNEAKKEEGDEE